MKKEAIITSRLIRLIAFTLMVQLLICRNVWIASLRTFPTVPLISGWHLQWGNFLNLLFFSLMIISCVWLLIKPFSRIAVYLLICLFILFILEDVNRLQPWFYLYLFMLSATLVYNQKQATNILSIFRLVLATTYFFSGLQKLNVHFAKDFFPWLSQFTGARSYLETHHAIAYISAGLEAVSGVCLFISKTRKPAAGIIICTHIYILLSLGPTGQNWDAIIWPWNILFAIMTYLLFIRYKPASIKSMNLKRNSIIYLSFVSLFLIVAPVLGLFGKWDNFLSDGFYSAVINEGTFYFPPSERDRLPASSRPFQYLLVKENKGLLFIAQWSLEDLKVPIYPEDRVYREVARKLSLQINDTDSTGLKIIYKSRFTVAGISEEFPFSSLE